MTDQPAHPSNSTDDSTRNSGDRTAAINADPTISLEEARNAAAGEAPNASGGPADSTVKDHVPSTSDPEPTDLPSSNTPVPD